MEQKSEDGSDRYRRDGEAAVVFLKKTMENKAWKIMTHFWMRVFHELIFGLIAFSLMVVMTIGVQHFAPGDFVFGVPMELALVFFQTIMIALLLFEGAALGRLSTNYHRAMLGLGMDPTDSEKSILKRYMLSARVAAGSGLRGVIYFTMVTICFWETFHARSVALFVCTLALVLVCRWKVVARREFMTIIEQLQAS